MQTLAGQLFALITACCWAHNSVVYGLAGRRVGSAAVTHIRLWIAVPIMLLVHWIVLGTPIPSHITVESLLIIALSGLLGFFLADICIFRAFVDLGHRETLVLLTFSPFISALISRFTLGESLSMGQLVGMLVTIAGIGWVVFSEKRSENGKHRALGVVYALIGAVAQAVGMVLVKYGMSVNGAVQPLSANLIRLSAGLLGIAAYRLIRGRFASDFKSMRDRHALMLIAQGAVVGPVFGIIMNLYALSLAPVGVVTTIMQVSPVLLLPVDRFVFKKKLPIGAYAGTLVAVSGAALLFIF